MSAKRSALRAALAAIAACSAAPALAAVFDVAIDGQDVIFLAGRSDVCIPAAGAFPAVGSCPGPFPIGRHGSFPASFEQERFPQSIGVVGGDVVQVLDPAVGGIDFFNSGGVTIFGPEGAGGGSNLNAVGGISGYIGPQGALVGVFLDDSVPSSGPAPGAIDFNSFGLNFASLTPSLRQVFFIGNGVTSGGLFQEFVAPTGATRLFFGIADGFGFVGNPGAYEDNDGGYSIRVGVNETPTLAPEPEALLLFAGALGLLGWRRRA